MSNVINVNFNDRVRCCTDCDCEVFYVYEDWSVICAECQSTTLSIKDQVTALEGYKKFIINDQRRFMKAVKFALAVNILGIFSSVISLLYRWIN